MPNASQTAFPSVEGATTYPVPPVTEEFAPTFAPDAFVPDWDIPGTYDTVTPAAVETPTWSI